jgi:hypothetical protein
MLHSSCRWKIMSYYKIVHVETPEIVTERQGKGVEHLKAKGVDIVHSPDASSIKISFDKFKAVEGKSKRREWNKFKKILKEVKECLELPEDYSHEEILPPPPEPPDLSKMSRAERKAYKRKEKEQILSQVRIVDDPEEEFDHFIEVAVACTWFQKRLSWMLSSILQQQGDVPSIIFNVAHIRDNGDPTTEEVCQFFREKGLNIKETVYDDYKIMQKRGFVRNRQLIESKAKWIMFADCDMAYDPYFFDDLAKQLRSDTFRRESRCISGRRVSLDKQYCKDKFNSDPSENYPRVVENAGELKDWPVYMISSACGAGYMQLANVRTVRANTDGLYVSPDKNPDYAEQDHYHKTKSDRVFRRKINGVKRIKTKPQYHLNHERDNEEGCHVTFQR